MSSCDATKSASQRLSNDDSAQANEINVNTPSPSSVGSASTAGQSSQARSTPLRSTRLVDHRRNASIFKRRYRFVRLLHAASHQYVTAMTNILSQMQRDMHKLKRRVNRIDNVLEDQIQCGYPVVRLPRLTKGFFAISRKSFSRRNRTRLGDLAVTSVNESLPEDCHEIDDENEKTPPENQTPNSNEQKTKFCSLCQHEFSSRSAFLQHRRKMHQGEMSDETTEEHCNSTHSDQSGERRTKKVEEIVSHSKVNSGRIRRRSGRLSVVGEPLGCWRRSVAPTSNSPPSLDENAEEKGQM